MKLPAVFLCALALSSPVVFCQEKAPAAAEIGSPVRIVTPAELEQLLSEKKAVVLDVRTPEEFRDGHIGGALNIDYLDSDFAAKIAALDRSKTYVVHCAAGNRSARALPILEQNKFSSVLHLAGGFKSWESAGKPVEKSPSK